MEPSIAFAEEGRQRFGVNIESAELTADTYPQASFDLVILSGVLEHVYDPIQLLQNAGEVLRSGGLLYVDVPNEASWFQEAGRFYLGLRGHDWCISLSPTFPPYHVVGFNRSSLRTALAKVDLELVEVKSYPLTFQDAPGPTAFRTGLRLIEALMSRAGRGSGIVAWARRR